MHKDDKVYLATGIKSLEVKAEGDNESLVIRGFANCTTLDRSGDIIIEDAWKGEALDNYLKNPIILAYHDHSQPIGKMVSYEVSSKGLEITAEISKAAGNVYNLIKEGILQAFSVGFRLKDATYDEGTGIFLIKEVELHEVSVVSVPCNQDSVFSVSKSYDGSADIASFKNQFKQLPGSEEPTKLNIEEDYVMDPKDLEKEIAAQVAKGIKDAETARLAAEAEAAEKAAKEAELAAKVAGMVESGAAELVKSLEEKRATDVASFNESVSQLTEQLKEKSEEIVALQKAKRTFHGSEASDVSKEFASDIEDAALTSMILNKQVGDTKFGREVLEKLNTASGYDMPNEEFETTLSSNIERDVQDMLVMAPMFREIKMNTAQLSLPIRPDRIDSAWVGAGTYGTSATTGVAIDTAMTEVTLTTNKLVSKAILVDETDEDVILAVLPLLRDSIIEGQASALDAGILNGSGASNEPTGLITRATATGAAAIHNVAKIAGSPTVRILSEDLVPMREKMGPRGLRLNNLVMLVNLDAYYDLMLDPLFESLEKVGARAHALTGVVGYLHGIEVVVTNSFPAVANDSVFGILVDKTNFMVPRQRGVTLQSQYDVPTQARTIVTTQRVGFAQVIADVGVINGQYDADGS